MQMPIWGYPPQSMDQKRLLWKSIISWKIPMFWGADSKMSIKPDWKSKNEKTSIKTDKTKVVELIVLSISRPVALRDHFLNDVLCPKYFSYNLDFFFEPEKSTKLLQDRALELKLSPPGFFNMPNRSKTTPGPQAAPNTSKKLKL